MGVWEVYSQDARKIKRGEEKVNFRRMIIDPVTRQRVVTDKHDLDVEYDLQGDSAVTEEVVSVRGPWTDNIPGRTEIGGPNSKQQQKFAGSTNQLFGQDTTEKLPDLDETGNVKVVTRRRLIRRHRKL